MKTTREVAIYLESYCTLLELSGAETFRARAYSNAVRIFENMEDDIDRLVEEKKLTSIKGIGKSVASLVEEFYSTGSSTAFIKLQESIPNGLLEMLRIPGLGPRKISILHKEANIDTVDQLSAACKNGSLSELKGFGEKTQNNILEGIELLKENQGRTRIDIAGNETVPLYRALKNNQNILQIEIAGSFRRALETVKDIDFVISATDPAAATELFTQHSSVKEVIQQGKTKSAVRLHSGLQVDLRIVSEEEFPYTLHHFTGSKEHNVALRARANERGLKINEYGLHKDEERIRCVGENDFFAALGLQYIPPELREGQGEIEAAEKETIPDLISSNDIKGMLHIHSNYSDGIDSISDLATAVKLRGFSYMGLTDHSQTAAYAGGLSFDRVKRQWEEIDILNETLAPFKILKGIESDILSDGSLDYKDNELEQFDFIVASIHSQFNMDREKMTERIVRAISHPSTCIIGHLTGRLLLERPGYELNLDIIFEEAALNKVSIEINAHPSRLDLDWRHVKTARDSGVLISINTDAHQLSGLDNLQYGIGVARKGWLQKSDVLNTIDAAAFIKFAKNKL
ncbi:MAG: DNA polymerase/3'-5' exonuclease PolX [Candidatus Latescibacterota bacterium]|nr:DNA polymerase/3'-5' exonuclease PolX [Candidatus Latescibacterota bacterium]